ncbi:hypothetical protein GCM10022254_28720 [Actinomadura meridiana]|uniref:Uncharacterized protein n=1 Tax=Actinomadura meridiana TaxID=559626 RepID=A0ABP8C1A3_9ACTN
MTNGTAAPGRTQTWTIRVRPRTASTENAAVAPHPTWIALTPGLTGTYQRPHPTSKGRPST